LTSSNNHCFSIWIYVKSKFLQSWKALNWISSSGFMLVCNIITAVASRCSKYRLVHLMALQTSINPQPAGTLPQPPFTWFTMPYPYMYLICRDMMW
jgi:hypothetical protein